MATENQKSLENVKIDGKTLEEYLDGGLLCREKIREDLKQLSINSAQELKKEVFDFFPSESKTVFFDEIDMFASLGKAVKEVENWGKETGDGYKMLFEEGGALPTKACNVYNVICWLDAMKWMQDWNPENNSDLKLKERCKELQKKLRKIL